MKKFLSIILAISLILTLLPSVAYATETVTETPAVEHTFTFGEGGITEFVQNTNTRGSLSIENNAFNAKSLQTREFANMNPAKAYSIYAAIELKASASGVYDLKLKTDTPTKYSADVSVYFVRKANLPTTDYTIADNKVRPAYFLGTVRTTKDRVGHFNFSTATAGVYEPVVSNDGNVRLMLEKDEEFYLIFYCDEIAKAAIVDDDPATEAIDGPSTFLAKNSAEPRQEFYLSGIKLTPVTEMNFNSDVMGNLTYQYTNEATGKLTTGISKPADWTISPLAGWSVNTELSKTDAYMKNDATADSLTIGFARSSKNYEPWSQFVDGDNNDIKARATSITLNTGFEIKEGYYRIKVKGGKNANGTLLGVYVDDKFAGWYDCYDASATTSTIDENEVVMNTLFLSPDDGGTVKVMLASDGKVMNKNNDDQKENRSYAVISKITFEYLGTETPDSAIPDKVVIENAPETLETEANAPVSAYLLMKDGSKYQFSGLRRTYERTNASCSAADEKNSFVIKTTDNLEFNADSQAKTEANINGVFTNADGRATGTVTANGNGEATITVNAKVDGVELAPATATIALPEPPAPAEPGEELTETVTFGFGAELPHLNGYISAPGYTANFPAQVPVGTEITLTARDSDDSADKFRYWMVSGRFYSAEKQITLTVARNTYVRAVYENEDDIAAGGSKLVYFWKPDKTLDYVCVTDNKPDVSTPDDITGMRFVGWYIDEETKLTEDTVLTETVTNAVAKYEPLDTEYTVKVNGEENKGKYNSSVSVSAPEAFTYWKLGEEKLSFRRAFEFFNYGNAEITSVFDESVKAVPTVVIEKSLGAAFITYDTPAGYERIEAGIIFGPTAEITVNIANSKANAQKTAAFGQFTAKPYANEQYARGYQIFKKDGVVRVIYTDAISVQ